jgi:tetratricopeptide (TPR) repeat protein
LIQELNKAERLANEGRLTDAEVAFARVIASEIDPEAFIRYRHFLERLGRLTQAEEMYRKVLDLSASGEDDWAVVSYNGLGTVYETRGNLYQAEQMYRKALEVAERLGHWREIPSVCTNLGNVYKVRGDLDQAEQMYRKALEIAEQLGHLEGLATALANLALVYETREDVDMAAKYYRSARDFFSQIGATDQVAQVERALLEL